jgi:uncharacterized membrane protein
MKRPNVRVNLTWLDWIMEVVAILILLAMIALLFIQYASLPSIIPTHFNASGEVDGYGGKWTVLLLAVVAVVIYVLATLAIRYPNLMNYPIPITEENHERQFLNAVKMRVLKCLSVILFFFLIYGVIQNAYQKSSGIGQYFLPMSLFAILGATGYFLYRGYKLR